MGQMKTRMHLCTKCNIKFSFATVFCPRCGGQTEEIAEEGTPKLHTLDYNKHTGAKTHISKDKQNYTENKG